MGLTPKVTIEPAIAAGSAARQAAANSSVSGMRWSAATTSRMAAGSFFIASSARPRWRPRNRGAAAPG